MRKFTKIVLALCLVVFFVGGALLTVGYKMVYGDNVVDHSDGYHYLYIDKDSSFDELIAAIDKQGIVHDISGFERIAGYMNYPNKIIPGKYKIANAMSNRSMVEHLRAGRREQVDVVVNAGRDLTKIAGNAARNLQLDSLSLLTLMMDYSQYGDDAKDSTVIRSHFIPDTYRFEWSTTERAFLDRMLSEHKKFWNAERLRKAELRSLSPKEVSILASIVEEEAYHTDEMPKIAGVYTNRLRQGWLLQADPTVKFAVGNFEIKRVLDVHLEYDSPYNTYKYEGLPPGPICIPSKAALEAVLAPEEHGYFYFCAKEDFSMYHAFATNLKSHMINARRYQRALNRKGIFK
ncbi:endolytic transglycosylase MltG [Chitinophagales bacterium]|nr:endolytic transglycosylase MltG [Chitinophagales bacterium]